MNHQACKSICCCRLYSEWNVAIVCCRHEWSMSCRIASTARTPHKFKLNISTSKILENLVNFRRKCQKLISKLIKSERSHLCYAGNFLISVATSISYAFCNVSVSLIIFKANSSDNCCWRRCEKREKKQQQQQNANGIMINRIFLCVQKIKMPPIWGRHDLGSLFVHIIKYTADSDNNSTALLLEVHSVCYCCCCCFVYVCDATNLIDFDKAAIYKFYCGIFSFFLVHSIA